MDRKPSTIGSGRPPLVIVGASCRAAAASASAAGWDVFAADVFDDLDLGATAAATRRAVPYPLGIEAAVAGWPAGPWCYTGALENHPDIIERISATRPLAGNPAARVRCVREPARLGALLDAAGLRHPETRLVPRGVPSDGSFLRKPVASAGGHGIGIWSGGEPPRRDGDFIWQRRVRGEPLSVVLALAEGAGRLLGLSRQLVGEAWCRAAPFAYCGSVAIPAADHPPGLVDECRRLASLLAAEAGVAGVVGVDLVLEADGRASVIEVNPRPTASAELVERGTGVSIMATHLAAFGLRSPQPRGAERCTDAVWSKAIVFLPSATAIDGTLLDRLLDVSAAWTAADGRPAIADIPRPGQVLRAGGPFLTIFARGDTPRDSEKCLRRRVADALSLAHRRP